MKASQIITAMCRRQQTVLFIQPNFSVQIRHGRHKSIHTKTQNIHPLQTDVAVHVKWAVQHIKHRVEALLFQCTTVEMS